MQAISGYIEAEFKGQQVLESITYRNLAPLYCDEKMRICGMHKKSLDAGNLYDVWIEGPSGGVAVRGTVRTVVTPFTDRGSNRQTSVRLAFNKVTRLASDPTTRNVSTQKSKKAESAKPLTSYGGHSRPASTSKADLSRFTVPPVQATDHSTTTNHIPSTKPVLQHLHSFSRESGRPHSVMNYPELQSPTHGLYIIRTSALSSDGLSVTYETGHVAPCTCPVSTICSATQPRVNPIPLVHN
jgi:hypothetical protein